MEYKFVDCNCVLGIPPVKSSSVEKSKTEDIKKLLQSVNVVKSFATHINSIKCDCKRGNEFLEKEIKNDDFFLPAYTVIPNHSDDSYTYNELDNILKNVRLVRLYPKSHAYSSALWSVGEILDIFDKNKTTLLIDSPEIDFDNLYEWLKNYNNINVILTGISFNNTRNCDALLKRFDNFFVDTTYVTPDGIEYITDKFGSERIVFSSCAPSSTPAGFAGRIIMSDIKESDKENIAYKNILRLTGVKL